METVQAKCLNCLSLAQSFETLWAYYSQSDGQIYDHEARQSARALLESLRDLAGHDNRLDELLKTTAVNTVKAAHIVGRLEEWARGDGVAPFASLAQSRTMLFGLLSSVKLFMHVELRIPLTPMITMSAREIEHSERALRWRGYLPADLLVTSRVDPDEIVRTAGRKPSIVVIGDIRRSQQLMTYVMDADGFTRLMGSFIQKSMELIQKHRGFFDKFTGDGFIAYFNEEICSRLGSDYVDCFHDFVKEETGFVADLFTGWSNRFKSIPTEPVGLAIGCDIGVVDFRDVRNHLIAVGDAVVWAHRMSGEGKAGEIIVHEPLAELIRDRPGIRLEQREGRTKHGMAFTANAMKFVRV